jgi:hypothetical protein
MSDLVITEKNSLISIADAIREKAELSENFTFPQGFIDAVSEIKTGIKCAIGTFTTASDVTNYTITHNLGVIPDFIVLVRKSYPSQAGGFAEGCTFIVEGFRGVKSYNALYVARDNTSNYRIGNGQFDITSGTPPSSTHTSFIYGATENKIEFGGYIRYSTSTPMVLESGQPYMYFIGSTGFYYPYN